MVFPCRSHSFPMIFPEFPRLWRIFGVPPHFNCRPTPSFKAVQLARVVAKAEGDAPVRPGGVGEIDHRFLGKPSRKPYKTPCPYLNNSWISMKMLIAMNSSELLKWILPSGWWLSPTPLKTMSSSVRDNQIPNWMEKKLFQTTNPISNWEKRDKTMNHQESSNYKKPY